MFQGILLKYVDLLKAYVIVQGSYPLDAMLLMIILSL
jgi:hypothetical protein